MPYLSGIIDIDQIIANQIVAAKFAEQTLKEFEGETEIKMTDIHGAIDEAQSLHESIAPIIKERDELV